MMKPVNPVVNRSHPLARGLVGAWPMQDGSGYTFRDVSGHEIHGAIPRGATPGTGLYGGCLDVPGTYDGSNITANGPLVANADLPDLSGSWTASAWARIDVAPTTNSVYLVGKSTDIGASARYQIQLTVLHTAPAGRIAVYIYDGGTAPGSAPGVTSPGTYVDGQWHHFLSQRDVPADMIRLYIDGVLIAETEDTTDPLRSTVSTAPLQMGWRYDYGRRLNGAIGDVRLYDRALTPSEVASMYQDPWALYRPARPVRKHYYVSKAAGGGAISTGLSAIEAGAAYGAPGLNSGLHAISTGIAT